jgi:hypothetical protein
VEYVVDFPGIREFQLVGDVRYLGDYLERSVSPWGEFHCFIGEA